MIEIRKIQRWLYDRGYFNGPMDGEKSIAFYDALIWCTRDRMCNENVRHIGITRDMTEPEKAQKIMLRDQSIEDTKIEVESWSIDKHELMMDQIFLLAQGYGGIIANGEPSAETTAAIDDYNAKV